MRRTFGWRGKYVYYLEGTTQGGMSIYRVAVSGPPWEVAGEPERITSPLAAPAGGSISRDGRLVFTSWTIGLNVWSLPLGPGQRGGFDQRKPVTTDSNIKWGLYRLGERIETRLYDGRGDGARDRDPRAR